MLNKDQYNQDEYNDYYRQEREGVEIKGYSEDKEGGFMGKALLFLSLIGLGIAGYFGFKAYDSTTENSHGVTKDKVTIKEEPLKTTTDETPPEKILPKSNILENKITIKKEELTNTPPEALPEKVLPKSNSLENKITIKKEELTNTPSETLPEKVLPKSNSLENKITKTTQINKEETIQEPKREIKDIKKKQEKSIQEEVALQVQEKLETNKKMSTEEISKIIDLVINKINIEKVDTEKSNNDSDLLNALENSDNDRIEVKSKDIEVLTNNLESTIEKKVENIDTYNKVTLNNSSIQSDKDLNKLEEQIKKLLNITGTSNNTYKKSISTSTETSIDTSSITNNKVTSNYENSIRKEVKVRSNAMRIIVVREGDTLNKIAQRAYGKASNFQKIYDANPDILNRPDRIYVGQKLRIPK